MTGTAKKSLLELEKVFNDQILGELKNGMQRKESVDHELLVGKVKNTGNEIRRVYKKLKGAYSDERRKAKGLASAEQGQSSAVIYTYGMDT